VDFRIEWESGRMGEEKDGKPDTTSQKTGEEASAVPLTKGGQGGCA